MKYDTFKKRVKEEFARWIQEKEAQRPRLAPGGQIQSLDELRVGDIIGKGWGKKYKIDRISPKSLVMVEVDRFGRPKNNQKKRRTLQSLKRNRFQRLEDLSRPDVNYDKLKSFVDKRFIHPPRDVTNRRKYKEWLKKRIIERPSSPYEALGDDEQRHQEALERQLKQLLDERGIGEDWQWQPPSPVQVGQMVRHPLQVNSGDFVQIYDRKYRVLSSDDQQIELQRVDDNGRARGGSGRIPISQLQGGNVKRIEPVERPDVSFTKAKEFADKKFSFPPRDINTRAKYRDWLEERFKTEPNSPYQGLGDDEVEHKQALEKQIKKILKERGIGPDWEWEAPEPPAIGSKYRDSYQMRPGHFLKGTLGYLYKILEVDDDGRPKAIQVDRNGRPVGRSTTLSRTDVRNGRYTRVEEVKRPEVSDSDAQAFARQYAAQPGRDVRNKEQYKNWLTNLFKNEPQSPYYQLGDDETSYKEKLEQQVEKILEARGIDADWKWQPPPLITFPANPDWESKQDEILAVARKGQKVGPDRAIGGVGGNGVNGAVRRKMELNGESKEYVFKSKFKEPGQPGSRYRRQLRNKTGIPTGTMHNREQGAYELDRLLGAGTIIPATTSAGDESLETELARLRRSGASRTEIKRLQKRIEDEGPAAYQSWVDGMSTFASGGWNLNRIPTEDLLRHQDVGRLLVMDVLMGHQDRHHGNVGFSWVDPNGPKTAQNLRIHGIDNGYSLAETQPGQSPGDWDIRDAWDITGPNRQHLVRNYFANVPRDMQERLSRISTKDVAEALKRAGIKKASVLEAVAVRLAVLKNNPAALYSFMSRNGSIIGQKQFQYYSHHKPEKLLRDHTNLAPGAYAEIQREVAEALRG